MKSLWRDGAHLLLSSGCDGLFSVQKQEGEAFREKKRLRLKWKTNGFEVIGDDVFLVGVSPSMLRVSSYIFLVCSESMMVRWLLLIGLLHLSLGMGVDRS